MKLSVVIPVYNERNTILEILQHVQEVALPKEIIVIDDGSTDGTRDILQGILPSEDIKIIFQPYNMGKGAALRKGFEREKRSAGRTELLRFISSSSTGFSTNNIQQNTVDSY